MRKALLISIIALLGALSAAAQNIALGERVPELKVITWLGGHQPAPAELTYIEFFHSTNPACISSLEQLKTTVAQMSGRLRVLVISQEKGDKVTAVLQPYASERIGVGFDSSGKTFTGFGVSYVPFGVLTDAKNRALWMGNSLQLTPAFIEKVSK